MNLGTIQIKESARGTDIYVPYISNPAHKKIICITISDDGINLAPTGTLNKAGQQALEDGLQLANLLQKYSKLEYIVRFHNFLESEDN